MAADAPDKTGLASETFVTLSLSGGDVDVPLEKQVWGDEFGECADRYGVRWSVDLGDDTAVLTIRRCRHHEK